MFLNEVKELTRQYEQGSVPAPGDLSGKYAVLVPWFPWLDLRLLGHCKAVIGSGRGTNVLLGRLRFGQFVLREDGQSLLIDYDVPGNLPHMRRVVDRIRRLPDGRLVGRLNYRLLGREVFLMFFEMRPREAVPEEARGEAK